MAENYSAALKGILSSLQSSCRNEDKEKRKNCRRAMEERVIINEVALSLDKPTQEWRKTEISKVKSCYDNCHVTGRYKIRECNSACLNNLIQGLWKRIDVSEFEKISLNYS
jgi:hypothetical protein